MSSITSIYYGVCVKLGEIVDQTVGKKCAIVPGELVKIVLSNQHQLIIKVYNRENKSFGRNLYQCNKENVKIVPNDIIAWACNLHKGTNVTLRVNLPRDSVNVNFVIKSYGDCARLGAGSFFGLDVTDTPELTEHDKLYIQKNYYNTDEMIIRADKLIEFLILQNSKSAVNNHKSNYELLTGSVLPNQIQFSNSLLSTQNVKANQQNNYNTQAGASNQTEMSVPINMNLNQRPFNTKTVNFSKLMSEEAQLHKLINGLDELRLLTAPEEIKQPTDSRYGSCNEFSSPSNEQAMESSNNGIVPPEILRKIENSSYNSPWQFETLSMKQKVNTSLNNFDGSYQNASSTMSNKGRKPSFQSKNGIAPKKFKPPTKNRNPHTGKSTAINTKCYMCLKSGIIHLNCQHVFCGACLVDVCMDLNNAYCPFQNGKFKCLYKLTMNDIKYAIETIEKSLLQENNVSQSSPNVARNDSKPKNVDVLVYEDDNDKDSSEVLFYCKQDKCDGYWFIDKSEGRNTYQCPLCKTFNCFKCQTIHDNMTCEESNQQKLVGQTQNNVQSENQHEPANDLKLQTIEFYRLLELEDSHEFIPNFDEFECIICRETIKPKEGIQLRGCLHNCCRDCIVSYIEFQDQAEIKCPFIECNNILEDREIKTLVSPQAYSRHIEIATRIGKANLRNGYQCCVSNCQGFWICTDQIATYNCPVCRAENCISCRASHSGIDCKTYQQNILYSKDENGIQTKQRLEQMLKSGEAEHCPNCNIIIVKYRGCNDMKCRNCKSSFEWGDKKNQSLNQKLNLK